MELKTITKEEHFVQVEYYQNIIKKLKNDIYNLELKTKVNDTFIISLQNKLKNLKELSNELADNYNNIKQI